MEKQPQHREKFEELISKQQEEKNVLIGEAHDEALDIEKKVDTNQKEINELTGKDTRREQSEKVVSFEEAESILGEDFFSPETVEKVFGNKPETVPNIPFSKAELQRAKELGQQLIFYTDALSSTTSGEEATPLTFENLKQKFTKAHDDGKVFYDQVWYNNEDFFKKEKPRVGWRLTSKDFLPGSTSKSYLEQTDVLVEHLEKQIFKGTELPKPYKDAVAEFKRKRAEIEPLARSSTHSEWKRGSWKRGSQMLADLAITKLVRELPVEAMYRLILNDQARKDKPLPSTYTWTASRGSESRGSDGYLVYVGNFGDAGAGVDLARPDLRRDRLGVSFSRC